MNTILIVFIAFHFEAGAAATQTPFNSHAKCEAARINVINEFQKPAGDKWGFKRITAICVDVK